MRIVAKLNKLGVAISATSVRNVLWSHGLGPAPERSHLVTVHLSTSFGHPCH
ncbi:MAG: hypothetical protein ACYDGN_12285 [Acidimicrobiales bacterium]